MDMTTNSSPDGADAAESPVSAVLVPDDQRLDTLPQFFGSRLVHAEVLVYGWMRTLCRAYSRGYWLFFRLSNGGFFMASNDDAMLDVAVDSNGYVGSMSTQAAGITACLFAFNQLANTNGREQGRFIELYRLLRDFVSFHPEANSIFQAID